MNLECEGNIKIYKNTITGDGWEEGNYEINKAYGGGGAYLEEGRGLSRGRAFKLVATRPLAPRQVALGEDLIIGGRGG